MASEETVSITYIVSKGGASDGLFATFVKTLAGTRFMHNVQSVGTSEEALVLGEIVPGGMFVAKNLDATNPIAIKAASGATPLVTLPAGTACAFQLHSSASAPFVQATTGACLLEYIIAPA